MIDKPRTFNGTAEQQLEQIKRYLQDSNNQINAEISDISVCKFWEDTLKAINCTDKNSKSKENAIKSCVYSIFEKILSDISELSLNDVVCNTLTSGSIATNSEIEII